MGVNQEPRHREHLFRGAMMAAPIGMCLVGADGAFLEVNPALCELLGRDEAELLATSWQDLTHPDDLEADSALVQQVLDGHRDSYRLLKRYLRPDGDVIWGDLSVSCVKSADGQVECFVSQIVDLTGRIIAERKLAATEEHYRLVAENAATFVLLVDEEDQIAWMSPGAVERSGYDSGEPLIAGGLDHVHRDDTWKILAGTSAVRSGSHVVTQDVRLRHRDGTYTWWSVTIRPVDDSRTSRLVLSFLDIDSEVRAREALKDSQERYRWLVDNMQDTLVATDAAGRITFASPTVVALLGWNPGELVGVRVLEITHPDDRQQAIDQAIALGHSNPPPITMRLVRSDGDFAWVEVHGRIVKDSTGSVSGSISVWHDASESRRREENLRHLAQSDPLTDLPNRRELRSRLEELLEHLRPGERAAVLFCDVDGLKQINDRHGHAAGDTLLRTVADRMRVAVRTGDLVARLGGDEVIIGLSGVHEADAATRAAEKVRAEVSAPVTLPDGTTVTPTLSIGVVLARRHEDVHALLSRADQAMYAAKARGGDQVVFNQ